jgi:hypothetical protein
MHENKANEFIAIQEIGKDKARSISFLYNVKNYFVKVYLFSIIVAH